MKIENIKFKAKALNSGEWVVGDLLHRITDTCIATKDMDDIVYYPVDPSTVCQFTGLKDCEGKEVWEGDVLLNASSGSQYTVMRSYYGGSFFIRKNGTVDDDMYLFELVHEDKGIAFFEVVGNKFDKEK